MQQPRDKSVADGSFALSSLNGVKEVVRRIQKANRAALRSYGPCPHPTPADGNLDL